MKVRWDSVVSVVLVVCALTVTALAVKRTMFTATSVSPPISTHISRATFDSVASEATWTGDPNHGHPLVVVEFADLECEFCALATSRLRSMERKWKGELVVAHRYFPLAIHPYAMQAAVAAECAGQQGRYLKFRAEVFGHQTAIGLETWWAFARDAGVPDSARFAACLDSPGPRKRVHDDLTAATKLGVPATPTYLLDGRMIVGVTAVDSIEATLAKIRNGSG